MAHVTEVQVAGVKPGQVERVYWICSKCEMNIPRHSRFCLWCGVKLNDRN